MSKLVTALCFAAALGLSIGAQAASHAGAAPMDKASEPAKKDDAKKKSAKKGDMKKDGEKKDAKSEEKKS